MNFYPDPYMMEEFSVTILPVVTSALSTALPSSILRIATYVLSSMALYTIAARRGIEKAWLSWIPVLNVWIIGSLSDQYRYVVKGQVKSKRKILLTLNLVNVAAALILTVLAVGMAVELITGAVYSVGGNDILDSVLGSVLGTAGLAMIMAGISIAAAVVRYMALYDIYTSLDPSNNVLFLVLSILFNVTEAFFLFFNRNKDTGMPPRRERMREPVCEPWEAADESM